MERQTTTSARSLVAHNNTEEQTLKDARAASFGAITGKKASPNLARTAPTKATPPTKKSEKQSTRTTGANGGGHTSSTPELPQVAGRLHRGPRQPWLQDAGSLSPSPSEDFVQYVLCPKPQSHEHTPPGSSSTSQTSKSNQTPPILRNGRVVNTSPNAPANMTRHAHMDSDIIIAQGGPPSVSQAAAASAPDASHSAAAGQNLLTPGAPQPRLRLARTTYVLGDETAAAGAPTQTLTKTAPDAASESDAVGLPKVLGTNSYSGIAEIANSSNSALDSTSMPTGLAAGGGGGLSVSASAAPTGTGLAEVHSPRSIHVSPSPAVAAGRSRSPQTTPVSSRRTPPAARSPNVSSLPPGVVGSYHDLDAPAAAKTKPTSTILTSHSRVGSSSSAGISPNSTAALSPSPVVALCALEEGTAGGNTKAMSRGPSRRNLFDSFKKSTSNKDLTSSVTSTQAPISRTGSCRALNGSHDDSTTQGGAGIYQHKPCGLHNFGATCYMNAALQCMMHTPNFLAQLEKQYRVFKGFTNTEVELQGGKTATKGGGATASSTSTTGTNRGNSFRFKGKDKDDAIVPNAAASSSPGTTTQRSFPATIALTELGLEKPHRPVRQLLQEVKAAAASYNEQFKLNGQNDAHEFLRTILYVIHDEVNQGKGRAAPYEELKDEAQETEQAAMQRWLARITMVDSSVIYDLFGGVLQSSCECLTCTRLSRTFDPFLDLSIPVSAPQPGGADLAAVSSGTPAPTTADDAGARKARSDKADNEPHGRSGTTDLDAQALEEGGDAATWQSGGRGFAKAVSPNLGSSDLVNARLPTFSRDRHGSFTRDELGSLCLSGPTTLMGACSVDDIVTECFARETREMMNGDNKLTCERCKAPRDMVRRCKVAVWPKILVLHMKRFTGDGHKDFTKVTYPQTFTISQNDALLRYRLCGVVCHSGSERFGHYTAYVCVHKTPDDQLLSHDQAAAVASVPSAPTTQSASAKKDSGTGVSLGVVQRLHTQLDTWYLCNDERISSVDAKEALSALENAYILFYHQL